MLEALEKKKRIYNPLYKEVGNRIRMIVKIAYQNGELIRLLKKRGDIYY